MRLRLRRSVRTVALAAAAVVSVPLLAAPAQAAGPSYVALGDSYSSGAGTKSYIDDGTSCLRSTYAYPAKVAAAKGYTLNFRACSGAVINDVTNTQLSALSSSTAYVTISIGGNDAGFASVLTECALPGWASNCNAKINTAQSYVANTLPARLNTLYASIRSRAPQAKVVVVGYPRIFNGEDCNVLTFFSPAEMTRLNQTADQLNSRLAAAASARGFTFANPTTRFTGHAWCAPDEWINGLHTPIENAYHPNKAGQGSGYTPLVSGVLTGASLARTTTARAVSPHSLSDQLARQQRRYADADRHIKPVTVRMPDLRSKRVRVAARKAGINLERWLARRGL